MVRIRATRVRGRRFLDLLDELGLLLWQDCMFAFLDYPDEAELEASVVQELTQVHILQGRLSGPSLRRRGHEEQARTTASRAAVV